MLCAVIIYTHPVGFLGVRQNVPSRGKTSDARVSRHSHIKKKRRRYTMCRVIMSWMSKHAVR